jgi:O-antigen ligase
VTRLVAEHTPVAPTIAVVDGASDRGTLDRWAALALWVTVATIPWAGVVSVGGGTAAKAVGLAGAPVALAAIVLSGLRRPILSTHVLAVGFLAWVVASAAWTIDFDLTSERIVTASQLVALLLLTWQCGPLSSRLHLGHAYVIGSTVTCVAVVVGWASGTAAGRFTAGDTNPNDVGFILTLAIPIAWYLSVTTMSATQMFMTRAFIALAVFSMLLTASRSALVLLPVALLILPLTFGRLRVPGRGLVLVLVVLVTALLPSLLPRDVLDRLGSTESELTAGTLNEREQLWEAAQQTIEEDPVLGVGAGASRVRMAEHLGTVGEAQGAHNTFLSVGADLGVVGLALFCLLLLSAVYDGLRAGTDAARLAVVLALLLVVGLQVRHWEYTKSLWAVLAILVELQVTAPTVEAADGLHLREDVPVPLDPGRHR